MKIRFSKRQKTTMLTLYAVAGILLCGVFFLPWVNPAASNGHPYDGGNIPADAVAHDPYRLPRFLAFDSSLSWETNLGGSGTEEVVASYPVASGILIFGNTDSTDFDFAQNETAAYFIILLGTDGKAVHYRSDAGTLAAIEPIDGGFLLCVNTQTEGFLIKTDALGIETARILLALASYRERIVAAYADYFNSPDSEPFHAVIECTDQLSKIRTLKIYVVNNELQEQYFRYFPRAQDMGFVTAFSYSGGFYLFANIVTDKSATLTYYAWNKASSIDTTRHNLSLSLVENFVTDAILPNGDGRYALLIRDTSRNIPYLVDCTQNFSAKPGVHALSDAPAEKTALLSDGESLFVYLYSLGDISEVFRLSADYSVKTPLPQLKNLTALYCHTATPSGILFCGQTVDSILIGGVSQNNADSPPVKIRSLTAKIKTVILTEDGDLILVGTASGKSLNIGGNFGKTDVWVCKVV